MDAARIQTMCLTSAYAVGNNCESWLGTEFMGQCPSKTGRDASQQARLTVPRGAVEDEDGLGTRTIRGNPLVTAKTCSCVPDDRLAPSTGGRSSSGAFTAVDGTNAQSGATGATLGVRPSELMAPDPRGH